jgi:hypothetical protein
MPASPADQPAPRTSRRWVDWLVALGLLAAAWTFYRQWDRAQVTDSRYALLLTETLLADRSVYLDRHFQPPLSPARFPGAQGAQDPAYQASGGYPYQIEVLPDAQAAGRVLLWYPNFPSVLAIPAVLVMHAVGLRTLGSDGRYDPQAEVTMQLHLGAALTALAVALIFLVGRVWLRRGPALLLAVAFAVASPLWSTSSRAMWTSTWGIVLQLLLWLLLLRSLRPASPQRLGGEPSTGSAPARVTLSPWLAGTLCAWLYFCRPALAVEIVAVMAWLAYVDRQAAWRTAWVGAAWASLFGLWSWVHTGDFLPSYYRHTHLGVGHLGEGLYGSLLSPGRGLLVYTPWLVGALAAVLWRWGFREPPRAGIHPRPEEFPGPSFHPPRPADGLGSEPGAPGDVGSAVGLVSVGSVARALDGTDWGAGASGARVAAVVVALGGTLAHAVMLACYPNWWGGHSYGARLMVDTLPLTVLWAAAGWRAMAALSERRALRGGLVALTAVLVVAAAWIHWRGVTDRLTFRWNSWPTDINDDHRRALDWRLPQFMAGLWPTPPPQPMPAVAWGEVLWPGRRGGQPHLLDGWSDPEGSFRWTEGDGARLCARLPAAIDHQLVLTLQPYLDTRPPPSRGWAGRGPRQQRLQVTVGDRLVATRTLAQGGFQTVRIDVPASAGRDVEVKLSTPDAAVPASIGAGDDTRRLGVAVHAIRWVPRAGP